MLKYRGPRLIKPGFIGAVLIVLIVAVGLRPEQLVSWATAIRYQALFTQAGGLVAGNDVTVVGHQSRHGIRCQSRPRSCPGAIHRSTAPLALGI